MNFAAESSAKATPSMTDEARTIAAVPWTFCQPKPHRVSDVSGDELELERHIKDCGRLSLAAYARWEDTGCFSDRGEADMWQLAMKEAIARRSPAHVARMEAARGLA